MVMGVILGVRNRFWGCQSKRFGGKRLWEQPGGIGFGGANMNTLQ